MSRRRFYAAPETFDPDRSRVRLGADEARHMRGVLRLEPGDEVYVFDGAGGEFRCVIEALRRDDAALKVETEVAPRAPESSLDLRLAVALLKNDKFDFVIQKATELGVTAVIPVVTKRADVRVDQGKRGAEKLRQKDERRTRIAIEAAKQSGRARIPDIAAPLDLKELLHAADVGRGVLFAETSGEDLNSALDGFDAVNERLTALVGPEGGWDDAEIEQARAAGWRVVTLGGRVLRAETAAIAVAALLQHRCGDLV